MNADKNTGTTMIAGYFRLLIEIIVCYLRIYEWMNEWMNDISTSVTYDLLNVCFVSIHF